MPVYLATRTPVERDRATVAVRFFLFLPQLIALVFVSVIALIVTIAGWFCAVVTGRLPEFARTFLIGYIRWSTRVSAYVFLLTDTYPPFSLDLEESYPVHVAVPPATVLNRLAVFFRYFLAIPTAIVSSVLTWGAIIVAIAGWLMIVFTGQMPPPLYEAERAALRYQTRYWGYLLMLTPEYPAEVMGDLAPPGTLDEAWLVRLSPQGRTAMVVLIVFGVIVEVYNSGVVL